MFHVSRASRIAHVYYEIDSKSVYKKNDVAEPKRHW